MLSTILEGGSLQARDAYLQALNLPLTRHLLPDPSSIGIKAVQELVLDLSVSTATSRVVWIEEAQTLTHEASNALLKILEEPPNHTQIYLTCPSAAALLPTIRSRCQVTTLPHTAPPLTPTSLAALKPLFALTPGDRLQHLSDFPSDKAELLIYLAQLAAEVSQTIKKTKSPAGLRLLSTIGELTLKTHQALKSNTNQTLTMTHYLLHLPRTK